MDERHFDDIRKEIGYPSFTIDETKTYRYTQDFPLEDHIERLEEIAEKAAKEFGNLRLLDKMESEWDGV
jgi:hypothetical protein